jgi:hypothetical protein
MNAALASADAAHASSNPALHASCAAFATTGQVTRRPSSRRLAYSNAAVEDTNAAFLAVRNSPVVWHLPQSQTRANRIGLKTMGNLRTKGTRRFET